MKKVFLFIIFYCCLTAIYSQKTYYYSQGKKQFITKIGVAKKQQQELYSYKDENGSLIYLTNDLLMKPNETTNTNLHKILKHWNAIISEKKEFYYKIHVNDIENVIPLSNYLYENKIAVWAHPNFSVTVERCNDALYSQQYYLKNTGQNGSLVGMDLNIEKAWEITKGCENIVVAVIDDGVEDHEDLNDQNGNSRVLNGFTAFDETGNGRPDSDNDNHGIACAGIIGASHNNIGIKGIAPNVKILPICIKLGISPQTLDEMAEAFNWAWQNGADIISCSFGGSNINWDAVHNAIDNAKNNGRDNKGCVIVFAAGNGGENKIFNLAEKTIGVGAINNSGHLGKYSNGERYSNIGSGLDLVAFGGDWDSEGNKDIVTLDRDNGYRTNFGQTSAAAPQVAGIAALILSVNPELNRSSVENILFNTANDMGANGYDVAYGHGRPDAFRAVIEAIKTQNANCFNFQFGSLGDPIKEESKIKQIFTGTPGFGIAAAWYVCDRYVLEGELDFETDNIWYTGYGLSIGNPNSGYKYVEINKINGKTKFKTYFYKCLYPEMWIPTNPYNFSAKSFMYLPPNDLNVNEILNSGAHKDYRAYNSITFKPGFKAELGSSFTAKIESDCSENIVCEPFNSQNNLKSGKINKFVNTSNNHIVEDKTKIQLFPNPNKGHFNLTLHSNSETSDYEIEIISLSGKVLLKQKNKFNITYNIHIPVCYKGLYLVKITDEEKCYIEKIVITD